jgi:hypothetical protein
MKIPSVLQLIVVLNLSTSICTAAIKENVMNPIAISLLFNKSDYLCNEQITAQISIINNSQKVVSCFDIEQGPVLEYEFKNNATNNKFTLSYAGYYITQYPQNRQKILPPVRELKPDESITATEEIGTYALNGIQSGTYMVSATYISGKEKYVSNQVTITINGAHLVGVLSICDPRSGVCSSMLAHNSNTTSLSIFQAFSEAALPATDSYYECFSNNVLLPVSFSLPVKLFPGKPLTWVSWLQGQTIYTTYVGGSGFKKKDGPITTHSNLLNARLVSTQAHITEDKLLFFVYGTSNNETLLQVYALDCKKLKVDIIAETVVPFHDQSTLYVSYDQKENKAIFVNYRNSDTSSEIVLMTMNLNDFKFSKPVILPINETVLAIGVNIVTTGYDRQTATILTDNNKNKQISVYAISETEHPKLFASFKKPQGPVITWAIGAGSANSIPVIAVSDTYLLWTETKQCKDWKTLAHASKTISYIKIHTIPDGLAYRRYLEGKFWAEYFDGEKFNIVPIPGILRE